MVDASAKEAVMTMLKTNEKTYKLPSQVAAAVMTGRREVLQAYAGDIGPGNVMTPKEQREVLKFLGDLIEARAEDRRKLNELEHLVKEYGRMASGLAEGLDRVLAGMKPIADD